MSEELTTDLGKAVKEVRDIVEDYAKPQIVTVEEPDTGVKQVFTATSGGLTPVSSASFDSVRGQPKRRTGTANLLDLDSFIAHTKRFADGDSVVFADNNRSKPSLLAVLDYHKAGAESDPRFGKHQGSFLFPLSDEWKAWNEADKVPMKMAQFAAFLEDRIIDVLPVEGLELNDEQSRFVHTLGGERRIASPAKLMELATGLQVFENSEVSSAVKLASGEAKMTFTSQHVDAQGGDLNVPSLFVLGIPVFVNGPAYQVLVRLRYRKVGADLMFFTELWRTDRVFDHAFDEAVAQVKEETSLPVLLGKPEANS